MAHAQFETIHPFSDGNGRTGRALAHALLRAYDITRRITVPVTAGLLADVQAYYSALAAFREGDLNPMVATFTHAAFSASHLGRALVAALGEVLAVWCGILTPVGQRRRNRVWTAPDVIAILDDYSTLGGRREFGG